MVHHDDTRRRDARSDGTGQQVYRLAGLDEWQLEDKSQDLRGQTLVSADGREVGRVEDMLADLDQERIVALKLHDGRLIDIDHVDVRDRRPVLLAEYGHEEAGRARAPESGDIMSDRIPVIAEDVQIGKREVELGRVHVRSRVVERPVEEQVSVTREHVDVERRPVDRAVSADEADSLLRDQEVEVSARGEEVVVGKTARVVEEVVVHKDVSTDTQTVRDTVRHTEVDVDDSTRRDDGRLDPAHRDPAHRR